ADAPLWAGPGRGPGRVRAAAGRGPCRAGADLRRPVPQPGAGALPGDRRRRPAGPLPARLRLPGTGDRHRLPAQQPAEAAPPRAEDEADRMSDAAFQLGLFERDSALARFEVTQEQWLAEARARAREIFRRKGRVTSDDLQAECPPPPRAHPNVMGAVFSQPDFKPMGFTVSKRRE